MSRPRQFTSRLALEPLEPRLPLAGNVTAQLVDPFDSGFIATLLVVGDAEANEIRIVEDAPGHVRIEGIGSTTVNGLAADELFTSGDVITSAEIHLGHGGDTLIYELTGDHYPHRIEIDTGLGNDLVTVLARGPVAILDIDTGNGDDSVVLDFASISAVYFGLRVNTGLGDDFLLFRADPDGELFFFSPNNRIETGQGNDVVEFAGTFRVVQGSLTVDLGAGDDTLIGDSESSPPLGRLNGFGDGGHDTVVNPEYFSFLFSFESIE